MIVLVTDILLTLFALVCAIGATNESKPFTSVVFYITFGLVVALCWVRLNAPDIALAEAAIGAGLSGIVFMKAYKLLGDQNDTDRSNT
ncbi:Na(+)/H(+) antiporter subunit B [Salinimonas chungwhensis]|uniref:Na(+)/H(+) antiporter subunit B n=1 Tax=Salinimonas chungwhensis TaxID=265425 RepID=UPI000369422F|nr:DUF4040 domain-containing protein [Salinimonas chungwhensis]